MSKNVLLTNANYIKTMTNISDNLSEKFLFAAINEAQEISLKRVLGEILLTKLKDLVSDGSINDTENAVYKDLLQQCQFFLAYTVVSKLVVTASFKLDNAGLYRSNDENMYYADKSDVDYMQEYYQNLADSFKVEIVNFCLNNRNNLPELDECQCHKIKSNLYSVESSGIVLGGARGRGTRKPMCNGYDNYYN